MGESKRRGVVGNRFEDLDPGIISNILSRLPIEWILNCECVCKTWQALIKDDYFVNMQMRRANHLPSSHVILESYPNVCNYKSGKIDTFLVHIQDHSSPKARLIPKVSLADTMNKETLKIMCTLNGWICLAPEVWNPDPVVVSNPLIKEDFIILPKSEHQIRYYEAHQIRHYESHQITLGFDHLINKYKAVRVFSYHYGWGSRRCFFEVITIGEESSWRQLFNWDNGLHFRVSRGGVFHQGSIYWIIDRSNPYNGRSTNVNRDYILEFDVSKEVFGVISFPDNMRTPTFNKKHEAILKLRLQIMEGGSLVLIENEDWTSLLHIWKISKGGNLNNPVVEYSSIQICLPRIITRTRAIALLRSNGIPDDFLLLERPPGQWMKPEKRMKHKKRRETQFLYYFPFLSSSKKRDRFQTLPDLPIQSYEKFISWCFKPSLLSVKKSLIC